MNTKTIRQIYDEWLAQFTPFIQNKSKQLTRLRNNRKIVTIIGHNKTYAKIIEEMTEGEIKLMNEWNDHVKKYKFHYKRNCAFRRGK